MKYKVLISLAVVTVTAICLNFNNTAQGNAAGAPAGVTGSPSDGTTCGQSSCHTGTGNPTAAIGWITSNIPVAGYTPGTAYTITATATYSALVKYGFEISPQATNGTLVGTMTAGTGSQLIGGGKYITHTTAGTTGSTGSHTWTFTWTAPPAGTGSFSFYGAFNCTNNDTHDTGDHIFTSSLAVNEMPTSGLDCGIKTIINPNGFDCTGNITANVVLQNFGTTTLTSATINYKIDAGTVNTLTWNGTLGSQTSTTITLLPIASAAGAHTFTAFTSAPNGSTDILTTNDSHTSNYTTVITGSTLPFTQGFETAGMPPAGWMAINPDNSTTWARTTTAFHSGTASAFMDNYNYNAVGQRDLLESPPINLTTANSPTLTFAVAYRILSGFTDSLMVDISTDCGSSWTSIYGKSGSTLATVSGSSGNVAFVPTTSQWRVESINLSAYQTSSSALFRFINGCGYGNDIYIDDINITGATGIAQYSENNTLSIYPNPSNGQFTVSFTAPAKKTYTIKLYNSIGQLVYVKTATDVAGSYTENVDISTFPKGMYMFSLAADNVEVVRKIITY